MGTVTITAQFTDYSAGAAWSTAQAGAQTAISQVCTDYSRALATANAVGNIAFIIDFGYGAYGSYPGGQPGTAMGGGENAHSSPSPPPNFYSYQQIRTALLAISSPNSIQSGAWNSTNLPSSTPSGLTGIFSVYPALEWAIGLNTQSQNSILGYVGIGVGAYNDVDPNGLGAGHDWYTGVAHEVGEVCGRLELSILWSFISAGTRLVPDLSSNTYFSIDNGTNNLASFNNTGSGDIEDFLTAGDAYRYSTQNGPCSRSIALPLSLFDWTLMTTAGWPLTPTGKTFAGLSSGVGSFGLVSLRR